MKVAQLCLTLYDPVDYTVHGILQARILEGVASILLQGIFPTQGLNPGLPHCRQILYQLSHKGSPRRLQWVAYPFPRGSSRSRNQTRVFCIAGGFFINLVMREAIALLGAYPEKLNAMKCSHRNPFMKMCGCFPFSLWALLYNLQDLSSLSKNRTKTHSRGSAPS